MHWYALKVFYNQVYPVKAQVETAGYETYVPVKTVEVMTGGRIEYVQRQLISSLLFVKAPEEYILALKRSADKDFLYYSEVGSVRPAAIPDREMEIFIFVTSTGDRGLEYLGTDRPEYRAGDRVRVIDGVFKGAEGYIKRIKRDRRLIVCVRGVAAVATGFIHPDYLEKIPEIS